jgi:hypothetical protein
VRDVTGIKIQDVKYSRLESANIKEKIANRIMRNNATARNRINYYIAT